MQLKLLPFLPVLFFGQIQISIDLIFYIEPFYRTLQSDNFLTLQIRNLKDKKERVFDMV
ncbi:MAG: hypothetical protein ACJAT4_001122 [Granulosicoccus sp.]|jgi:hypothetical protein